jgi:hypothetical protein
MYSYKLIIGGYEIYYNTRLMLRQTSYPNRPDLGAMDERTSEQIAKLAIMKLDNKTSPFITLEEEIELSNNEVNTSRLMEIVLGI